MARNSERDRKLVRGFEESLSSVIGETGARAFVKLGHIAEDKFDAKAIDSTLSNVFGQSQEGLSIVHRNVIKGMSSSLGVDITDGRTPDASDFSSSLMVIAKKYRLKEKTGFGVAGFAAGIVSSVCCLGPIAFALLGLASLSASLSLAIDLTSRYKPIELAASVGFLAAIVYFQLRRHGQCSLSGLRRNLAYVVIPGTMLLVTYALLNYWVGIAFFGRPLLP